MTETTKTDFQAGQEGASAAAAHPWDGIDVSAWFDTSFLTAAGAAWLEAVCLSDSGFYEEDVPAERSLTWWAAAHPEEEKEAMAARLAVSLELARPRSGQQADAEAEAHYEELLGSALPKLAQLADEGCVTANVMLGAWHQYGTNVGKDLDKAKKHYLLAAEKGDPCAAFALVVTGLCPDRTEELYRKSLECGCPAALMKRGVEFINGLALPEAEFEDLAAHLAAFAVRRMYVCLVILVRILQNPAAESLRETYARPMLDLLHQAAAAGVVSAMELLGEVLQDGALCERDVKKAGELFKEAGQKGSASGSYLHAVCLFDEIQELPPSEAEAKMQEACAALREACKEGRCPEKAYLALGGCLVSSDDEEEFKEGIACLGKSLVYKDFESVLGWVGSIVMNQKSPQRRAQALKLLDSMIEAGSTGAIRQKGIYFLMGLYGREAREQGIELLLEAGQKGDKDAWSYLAAVYALGLCGFCTDLRQALLMAIEGDKAGSEEAHIWRIFLELGEFSESSESIADLRRHPNTSARNLIYCVKKGGSMLMSIMETMIWLDATDLRSKVAPLFQLPDKPHPAGDFDELAHRGIQLAQACVQALKSGQLPLAAFCAHALKKISRTEYCQFCVEPLAVLLGMPQDASPAEVTGFLDEYLAGLPESFCQFRDRAEDPDLEAKLAAWAEHLRAAVGK